MSVNAPQKLSVKRKRGEAPVEALLIADSPKRPKIDSSSLKRRLDQPHDDENKRTKGDAPEGTVVWRLVNRETSQSTGVLSPLATSTRRFHVSRAAGNVVLFEHRSLETDKQTPTSTSDSASISTPKKTPSAPPSERTTTPRKRPGARAAVRTVNVPGKPAPEPLATRNGPSDATIAAFEKFSAEVESGIVSPSKIYKPKAPRLRYSDRHPSDTFVHPHAAKHDPDAMDVDSEGYVYDTYVREILLPDASGVLPSPQTLGTVGYIVLTEEDEEWWYDTDADSDREFDTDDEDENAEDYYANDYPEDELSEDDEFDRNPYSHYRDENDDLYDLENDDVVGSDEDSDAEFRQTVPKVQGVYWGKAGDL